MSECVVPEMPDGRRKIERLQLEIQPKNKEMDILKNLPSFDSENFSKFLSHGSNGCSGKNVSHSVKYVKLKRHSDSDMKPQVIVMEPESLILKELEMLIARQQTAARNSLKRSSSMFRAERDSDSSTSKVPRTDDEIDSISSWSFDYS